MSSKDIKKAPSTADGANKSDAFGADFADDPLSTKIGKSLRSMYDEVANEPIPDSFMDLLAKADSKESNT